MWLIPIIKHTHYILFSILAFVPALANAWTVTKGHDLEAHNYIKYTLTLEVEPSKPYAPKIKVPITIEHMNLDKTQMVYTTACYIKLSEEISNTNVTIQVDDGKQEKCNVEYYKLSKGPCIFIDKPYLFHNQYLNEPHKFKFGINVSDGEKKFVFQNDEPLTNVIDRIKAEMIEASKSGGYSALMKKFCNVLKGLQRKCEVGILHTRHACAFTRLCLCLDSY